MWGVRHNAQSFLLHPLVTALFCEHQGLVPSSVKLSDLIRHPEQDFTFLGAARYWNEHGNS